jgi:hypothetical protein
MCREVGFLAGLLGVALWSGLAAALGDAAIEVAARAPAESQTALTAKPATEPAVEPARIALLTEHLDGASGLAAVEPFLPAIGGTLCAAGTIGLAVADTNEMHMSRTAMLLPTTLCAAASFGSYLLPREYQGRVVQFSVLTSLSALLVIDVLTSPELSNAEQVTTLGFSSVGAAVGTLALIDAALERPVSWTTLANDEAELKSRGTSLSRADVQRIEADYRHYRVRPIPAWAYGATQLLSGAVAMSPAFVPSTSHDEKMLALALGCAIAIPGAINLGLVLALDNQYERYEKGLTKLRLSPIGPRGAAGLWARGVF